MRFEAARRVHVYVSGVVQGVYYRASTQREAERLGLHGWVRNLHDGRVEFEAEGPERDVEALLSWARQGPPAARVDHLQIEELAPTGRGRAFEVRPTTAG